jgi:hypothetical protein
MAFRSVGMSEYSCSTEMKSVRFLDQNMQEKKEKISIENFPV